MTSTDFSSLANELVLQIASGAGDASLLSLLLCNRSLNNLLTPILHTRALAPRGDLSAMQWAAAHSHVSLVKFLLSRGIHPDNRPSDTYPPALLSAVKLGRADIVALLLSDGADVNRQNHNENYYFPPIVHIAVHMGDTAMLLLLVAYGADAVSVNMAGIYVGTPLHRAVRDGHVHIVKALLDMRVPLDDEDSGAETPLQNARWGACRDDRAAWDDMVLIGEMLVRAGAIVDSDENNVAALSQNRRWEAEFERLMLAVKRDAVAIE